MEGPAGQSTESIVSGCQISEQYATKSEIKIEETHTLEPSEIANVYITKEVEKRSGSGVTKSRAKSSLESSTSVSVIRRNGTGGLLAEKQSGSISKQQNSTNDSMRIRKSSASCAVEPSRRSVPDMKRSLLNSTAVSSQKKKSGPVFPVARTFRTTTSSGLDEKGSAKRHTFTQSTVSSPRNLMSLSLDSSCRSTAKKSKSKLSSSSARSPSATSALKCETKTSSFSPRSPAVSSRLRSVFLSSPLDQSLNLSGFRKDASKERRGSRLPQVESKMGDDVRLDVRGHRIRNLTTCGINLPSNLEFVYLRDNFLASLEGIEILKWLKVLDLSFNEFRGTGFEPLGNCQVLQQLYLAGNQITSLSSLPQLPNLEFLSVAQNKLKSLSMECQPRLQVLAASKNKISSLRGFPYLPQLEHLKIEENPILKLRHLEAAAILLVGATLKKFNDRDLSEDEVAVAKHYPAHTAVCIHNGWELGSPEHAADSTFNFLLQCWKDDLPPRLRLKEASVDPPFEEDACRCHFIFVQDDGVDSKLALNYQWYLGDRALSTFTAIPDATGEIYYPKHEDVNMFLKVECIPVYEDMVYPPIFAISSPISPGTGCPKVLNLDVRGDLVEGNLIKGYAEVAWCGGTPGKSVASWLRRKWNSSPVVIVGAEGVEYQLTIDDIDSSLVFMYTPVTEEGVKGEPQYAITDFVKAAPPSISNLQIIGYPVEGSIIKGAGIYFGGQEGPSKFEWLREDKDTGDFTPVVAGTAEYMLTSNDVGKHMAFLYTPINFEGKEGRSASVVSEAVKRAPPKVANLKIVGDIREGSKVTVTGTVSGGTESSSRAQWFKSKFSAFDGEEHLEALSTSKIAKVFRVPLGAVGLYIVSKFTPMSSDGECGMPEYVVSDKIVETLPPGVNFLSVTGDYVEGDILTASYGYVGGREGNSMYGWYLHENATVSGTQINEVSGLLQYQIPKDAIGKFVSFKCTPVRDDGIVGQTRTCMGQECVRAGSPRLLSLQLVGKPVEGAILHAEKKYWGGKEGESFFCWFRVSSDGEQTEIAGATTSSYALSVNDIGCFICVSCEPVRNDGARGPTVLSEKRGPTIAGPPTCHALELLGSLTEGQRLRFTASYTGGIKGSCFQEWHRIRSNSMREKLNAVDFLDLSLDDVGSCIEIVFTPVRNDGARGISVAAISDAVSPADPIGLGLEISDCYEDMEVIPHKRYFGGHEGAGEYVWYRTKDKLHGSSLIEVSNACEGVVVCGNRFTYTPSIGDVGCYLAQSWVPTRDDGRCGEPFVSISFNPVEPAHPTVTNVRVATLSLNAYSGEGQYFGGHEGSSLFSWYRETADGTIVLINGADSRTYEVTDLDYNCRLLFGYTPVRSDSVVGELRLSEPSGIILPEIPQIEMVSLTGKAIEGDVLTAVEVIPTTESQLHVWTKYKKHVRYQWYRSSNSNDQAFEPLPSHRSCSYNVRYEDIGRCFKCECIVTDVFGRSTEPVCAETSPILPGIPIIDGLEIEGRGLHTNLYAAKGTYSGGREGKSRIQWLRSMVGSPDLINIPGELGRMYEANVDDVGYRLVAIYTPVREDGVEGQPVSASTEPITVEPDVLAEVKKKLDASSMRFEVLCDKDRSAKKGFGAGSLERRALEINRKRVKVIKPGSKTSFPITEVRGTYAPPFHVELSRNDQHRLRIVVDSDKEVDIMVHTRHLRDVIVLVLRGLAQRFNSTSLNSLLKLDS